MRYAEWNKLTDEQKRSAHWNHHPRIRIATLFAILFAIVFAVVLLRIFQNRRMHVNRKPNDKEAFTMAKVFIKDNLKQAQTATFTRSRFNSLIDTAKNSYQFSSSVNSQDSAGITTEKKWLIRMSYTGGDWENRNSWTIKEIAIRPYVK